MDDNIEKRIADLEKAIQNQQLQIKSLSDLLYEQFCLTKQNLDVLRLELDLTQNHGTQQ